MKQEELQIFLTLNKAFVEGEELQTQNRARREFDYNFHFRLEKLTPQELFDLALGLENYSSRYHSN